MKSTYYHRLILTGLILVFILPGAILAQDSYSDQFDSNTIAETPPAKKEKKDRKRKDEFKVFAGINMNQLNIADERYYSNMGVGWNLGFNYKRGRFFYWEIGARYNNPVYTVRDNQVPGDSVSVYDEMFAVRQIDVPITGGINFLSVTSRIIGVRLFVSAVPSFTLGVGNNDHGVTKDDLNSFIMYGQAGVGIDITFLYVEAAFDYGFTDLFKNDFQSNPFMLNVCLGFRF